MFCFVMTPPCLSVTSPGVLAPPLPSRCRAMRGNQVCLVTAPQSGWLAGTASREPLGAPCSLAACAPGRTRCPGGAEARARPCSGQQAGPHTASAPGRQYIFKPFPGETFASGGVCLNLSVIRQEQMEREGCTGRKVSVSYSAGGGLLPLGPGVPQPLQFLLGGAVSVVAEAEHAEQLTRLVCGLQSV